MSVFSSAIPSVLHGHNASVKAWCLTARVRNATNTQSAFDSTNFIDGYNLRLDVESQSNQIGTTPTGLVGSADVSSGALKFSFITPMQDENYKVFLQAYVVDGSTPRNVTYAHVLRGPLYPKTKNSFWVRTGIPNETSPGNNVITGIRLGSKIMRLGVVVL